LTAAEFRSFQMGKSAMSRTKSGPTSKLLDAFLVAMTVTPSSSEAQSDMSPSQRLYEKQGGDASKQLQQQSN
jgi:hypothetical protein